MPVVSQEIVTAMNDICARLQSSMTHDDEEREPGRGSHDGVHVHSRFGEPWSANAYAEHGCVPELLQGG